MSIYNIRVLLIYNNTYIIVIYIYHIHIYNVTIIFSIKISSSENNDCKLPKIDFGCLITVIQVKEIHFGRS